MFRQNCISCGAQPTFYPIPGHRLADPAAHRKPNPNCGVLIIVMVRLRCSLKNETRGYPLAIGALNPKEFRTFFETREGRTHSVGPRGLGGEALAPFCPTFGQDTTTADGRHTGAKAVTTFSDEIARLISPLHLSTPGSTLVFTRPGVYGFVSSKSTNGGSWQAIVR